MPQLSEREIRRQNRIRIPLELRNELALKKLEQKKKKLAEFEEKLLMSIKNQEEDIESDLILPQKRQRLDSN